MKWPTREKTVKPNGQRNLISSSQTHTYIIYGYVSRLELQVVGNKGEEGGTNEWTKSSSITARSGSWSWGWSPSVVAVVMVVVSHGGADRGGSEEDNTSNLLHLHGVVGNTRGIWIYYMVDYLMHLLLCDDINHQLVGKMCWDWEGFIVGRVCWIWGFLVSPFPDFMMICC